MIKDWECWKIEYQTRGERCENKLPNRVFCYQGVWCSCFTLLTLAARPGNGTNTLTSFSMLCRPSLFTGSFDRGKMFGILSVSFSTGIGRHFLKHFEWFLKQNRLWLLTVHKRKSKLPSDPLCTSSAQYLKYPEIDSIFITLRNQLEFPAQYKQALHTRKRRAIQYTLLGSVI